MLLIKNGSGSVSLSYHRTNHRQEPKHGQNHPLTVRSVGFITQKEVTTANCQKDITSPYRGTYDSAMKRPLCSR